MLKSCQFSIYTIFWIVPIISLNKSSVLRRAFPFNFDLFSFLIYTKIVFPLQFGHGEITIVRRFFICIIQNAEFNFLIL